MKTTVFPKPPLWKRIIEAIKDALSSPPSDNRETRRREAKTKGAKRTDGKFRGNPSLPSAIKEYKLQREVHRK
jgi:hypothetical protein